jgi:hypothetical protein
MQTKRLKLTPDRLVGFLTLPDSLLTAIDFTN